VSRIFIVDDHRLFVDGLVALFNDQPDMKVVGTATDTSDAMEKISSISPEVVLLDIQLGIEFFRISRG